MTKCITKCHEKYLVTWASLVALVGCSSPPNTTAGNRAASVLTRRRSVYLKEHLVHRVISRQTYSHSTVSEKKLELYAFHDKIATCNFN